MLRWSIKDVSPKNGFYKPAREKQSLMRIFDHLLYCLGQKTTTFILEFTLYKVLSKSVVHLNKIKTKKLFLLF